MTKKYLHIVTNINFGEFICSLNNDQQKKLYSTSPLDIYGLFATDSKMFAYLSLIKNIGDSESDVIEILKTNSLYKSDKIVEVLDSSVPREMPWGGSLKSYNSQVNDAISSLMSNFSTFDFYEEESHQCILQFGGPESMKISDFMKKRDTEAGMSVIARHKIEVIKVVKTLTKMGLKEAKDLVDKSLDGDPQWATYRIPIELTKTEIHNLCNVMSSMLNTVPYQFNGVDILRNKRINQIIDE